MTVAGHWLDRVTDATEAAIRAERRVPVRMFLVAEVVDADGRRLIIETASEDTTHWEILGMLHHAVMSVELQMRDEEHDG